MDLRKVLVATTLACAVLMLLPGCINLDPRTSNQGGGTLISAGAKVGGGSMSGLTPDEIQILADFAVEQGFVEDQIEVTDEQAALVSEFLRLNNLNTIQDVQNKIDNPDEIEITQEMIDAIEAVIGTEFDETGRPIP